jgi:hypothetical protein
MCTAISGLATESLYLYQCMHLDVDAHDFVVNNIDCDERRIGYDRTIQWSRNLPRPKEERWRNTLCTWSPHKSGGVISVHQNAP